MADRGRRNGVLALVKDGFGCKDSLHSLANGEQGTSDQLTISTRYYSTEADVFSFGTVEEYLQWTEQTGRDVVCVFYCLSADAGDVERDLAAIKLTVWASAELVVVVKGATEETSALRKLLDEHQAAFLHEVVHLDPSLDDVENAKAYNEKTGYERLLEILSVQSWPNTVIRSDLQPGPDPHFAGMTADEVRNVLKTFEGGPTVCLPECFAQEAQSLFSGLVRTEVPKPYSQVNADIAAILHDAKKTYLLRKSDAAGSTRAHPKSAADESKRKQEHMAQKLSDIYESLRLDQSSAPSEKMPELLDKWKDVAGLPEEEQVKLSSKVVNTFRRDSDRKKNE